MPISACSLRRGLAATMLLAAALHFAGGAEAASLTTLYSFCAQRNCTDGSQPLGTLLMEGSGNLYGTTLHGGAPAIANNGAYGHGTVFELSPGGSETVLHTFFANPHDGLGAYSGLIMDPNGDLFGTTISGGYTKYVQGDGTVFEIPAGGTLGSIYQFCAKKKCADGRQPAGPVIMDAAGNLYGTTTARSREETGGTVYELSPNSAGTKWTLTTLYVFPTNTHPSAGLVMDGNGNLYGTTSGVSGSGETGTAFELTPNGKKWTATTLYKFCSQAQCTDGGYPFGGLILDASGNLYGTTESGGNGNNGTVFELSPGGTETVLYRFCSKANCVDGFLPMAGVIIDGNGNLYGTTYYGGTGGVPGVGAGTVFELVAGGSFTVLYSFGSKPNFSDGRNPQAGLIIDGSGNLYGATSAGGANYDASASDYGGTVFMLTP